MATHYSSDGKSAYEIKDLHPECPIHWDRSARHMITARIDYEHVQDAIIEWYEKLLNSGQNPERSDETDVDSKESDGPKTISK